MGASVDIDKLEETKLKYVTDKDAAIRLVREIIEQQKKVEADRSHGLGLVGAYYTEIAQNASAFLTTFSGVVEVAKAADSQYGGAIYGAVSLLFVIGVNKGKKEELINQGLQRIQESLPQLDTLVSIYEDEDKDKKSRSQSAALAEAAKDTYVAIKDYAQCATDYWKKGSLYRFANSFVSPKAHLEDLVNAVTARCSRVEREASILAQLRLKTIQEENRQARIEAERKAQEQLSEITDLRRLLKESEARANAKEIQNNEDRLHGVQQKLFSTPEHLKKHHERTDMQTISRTNSQGFDLKIYHPGQQLEILTEQKLVGEPTFCQWTADPKESSLLLLSGVASQDAETTNVLWLSKALPITYDYFGRSQEPWKILTYSFQPQDRLKSQDDFISAVRSIILTIFNDEPALARRYYDRCDCIDCDCQTTPNTAREALELLSNVLGDCETIDRTLIMIDRVDQCVDDDVDPESLAEMTLDFLDACNSKGRSVKVLLTMEESEYFYKGQQAISERHTKNLNKEHSASLHIKDGWEQGSFYNQSP